jgi:predicted DNA-binding transcriptional regulator YafY
MSDKKSRILYIKRFLDEQADEDRPVAVADILTYLSGKGIVAHQKTVLRDIDQLIEAGIDIICDKGHPNRYFIGDRLLEAPELKLLLDAVQASKFLTAGRSRALIGKLLSLASVHQAKNLKNGLYADNQIKPKNTKAYITAGMFLTAINTKRRVQFKYYEYTPEKKKVYKHGQRVYELSPWAFVWNNDSYYIIGHSKTHGKAAKFRVDRIATPTLTDLPAVPVPKDFNLAAYVQSVYQMYDGPLLDVTLKCENTMMKTIVDRFGEDVHTDIADAGHFYAKVRVAASKTFYGWIFGMDGSIRIEAPAEAVKVYRAMLDRAKQL